MRILPLAVAATVSCGTPPVSAPASAPAPAPAEDTGVTVRLEVPGRTNATPGITSAGDSVAVAWGVSLPGGQTDVFVAMSADGGRTFGTPVRVNAIEGDAKLSGEQPPRVALRGQEVFVLWTAGQRERSIKLSRSRDGGRTFDAAVALQAAGAPGNRGWPALTVDAAGEPQALWLDHRGMAAKSDARKSETPAGHDHHAHGAGAGEGGGEGDGVAMAQKSRLYFAGGGRPEQEITPGVCYCCKTALVADDGGVVAAAWRHVYPGNLRDIAFVLSRDGGRTFGAPVRVNEDKWRLEGCPDDGPAMVVDRTATFHLVWPTVVEEGQQRGVLHYATSRDGRTFTAPRRVETLGSLKPTHPQIATDARGQVVVAWDEAIDGRRVAAARPLVRMGNGISFGPIVTLDATAGSYPVLAGASRGVIAAWTSGGDTSAIAVRRVLD